MSEWQNPTRDDIKFCIAEWQARRDQPILGKISVWAEKNRLMPASSPFPGFWRNDRTPYLVDIMDDMSPASIIQHLAAMKGVQTGLTSASENVMGYWIAECPAPIMYVSATKDLLERWVSHRLEPMVDSCGLRNRFIIQNERHFSRQSADKAFSKEYAGGALDMVSAQSPAGLRSESKRILIRDEIDGAPKMLVTEEGNWLEVSYARTSAYEDRKKVMDFSTPTTYEASQIYQQYLRGDQRKFLVPCPFCGKYQELVWQTDGNHGIRAETKAGHIVSVFYMCEYCHEPIRNHHKSTILMDGAWETTSVSESKVYRSYHISTLYSPIGMTSWESLYREFIRAQDDPDGMRAFTNLRLGLPYKEKGTRPKLEKVIELRGAYKSRTVSDGVLFLAAGVDVQRGSKKDENHPARLEMEVCGFGIGYRTMSVCYEVFAGDVTDPFGGAWESLFEYMSSESFIYFRKDGFQFAPLLVFIDSGDGESTHNVYSFCERMQNVFPSKGDTLIKVKKGEIPDVPGYRNQRKYRTSKLDGNLSLYTINTVFYKNKLYGSLMIPRNESGPQRPNFCDFPMDYSEKYFRMLTAEEKKADGTYDDGGRRNESLDCRVMAMCASDVWLDNAVITYRATKQNEGYNQMQLQQITTRTILDILAARTRPKLGTGEGLTKKQSDLPTKSE